MGNYSNLSSGEKNIYKKFDSYEDWKENVKERIDVVQKFLADKIHDLGKTVGMEDMVYLYEAVYKLKNMVEIIEDPVWAEFSDEQLIENIKNEEHVLFKLAATAMVVFWSQEVCQLKEKSFHCGRPLN